MRAVLITGGGTGIGAAAAGILAADGWRVAVNGRRPEPLAAVAAATGGIALPGDSADEAVAHAVVAAAVERLGGLDGLVLSAGAARGGAILDQTTESLRSVLRANLEGPFHVIRAALPHLLERRGAIVVVSSLAALRVGPESAAYSTAKAAVTMLARTVAVDYGRHGVRTNVVCPAWVRTDMGDAAVDWLAERDGITREAAYARANEPVPLGRPAEADEVAGAIAWLLSERATYVNGAVVVLDGGASVVDVPTLAFRPIG